MRVEQPFTYTDAGGKTSRSTQRVIGAISALRSTAWERVSSGYLFGSLMDGLSSRSLTAPESRWPTHRWYEAWDVTGPGSIKFVCRPGGGEPAIWS